MPEAEPVEVRRAELRDLAYIDALRRRESEALGLLPLAMYEAYITGYGGYARPAHRIWLAEVNGDPVGFLYLSPGRLGAAARIIQIAVQEDARRLEYGAALVLEAEQYAEETQRAALGCRVATDLDATHFWEALGFLLVGTVQGGVRRGRVLERRYKRLECGLWTG